MELRAYRTYWGCTGMPWAPFAAEAKATATTGWKPRFPPTSPDNRRCAPRWTTTAST